MTSLCNAKAMTTAEKAESTTSPSRLYRCHSSSRKSAATGSTQATICIARMNVTTKALGRPSKASITSIVMPTLMSSRMLARSKPMTPTSAATTSRSTSLGNRPRRYSPSPSIAIFTPGGPVM